MGGISSGMFSPNDTHIGVLYQANELYSLPLSSLKRRIFLDVVFSTLATKTFQAAKASDFFFSKNPLAYRL